MFHQHNVLLLFCYYNYIAVLMTYVPRNILLSNNCAKLSSAKLLFWFVYIIAFNSFADLQLYCVVCNIKILFILMFNVAQS